MSRRENHYKLTDPFCLFWLYFAGGETELTERWQSAALRPAGVWQGQAFENLCFSHILQIKKALGISGVITSVSVWSKRPEDPEGTQTDLLLFRNDRVVNLCEIRYSENEFAVDLAYYQEVLCRQELLLKDISPKYAVHSTLITPFGLRRNEYAGAFLKGISLDDLFERP